MLKNIEQKIMPRVEFESTPPSWTAAMQNTLKCKIVMSITGHN